MLRHKPKRKHFGMLKADPKPLLEMCLDSLHRKLPPASSGSKVPPPILLSLLKQADHK